MTLTETLKGTTRTYEPRRKHTQKEPVKTTDQRLVLYPKPMTLAEQFKNAILIIDIKTGEIKVHKLFDLWASENKGN